MVKMHWIGRHSNDRSQETREPLIFLSSTFKDDLGHGLADLRIRPRLQEAAVRQKVRIWLYESEFRREVEAQSIDADLIVDRCVAAIKACSLFVFVISGRFGSGVSWLVDRALPSYLELELFAAALFRKPILVLHYRGREPEAPLQEAMRLLRNAVGAAAYHLDDEDGLVAHFEALCLEIAAGRQLMSTAIAARVLPTGMSWIRSRSDIDADLATPMLGFLDGEWNTGSSSGDLDKARALIAQVRSTTRTVGGRHAVMPHGVAMFRLWAAMRELLALGDCAVLRDPDAATLWDELLATWSVKASWFGLHGHTWMGPLAALNSQIGVRAQLPVLSERDVTPNVREPFGARASALYSIAKEMTSIRRRAFHLRQAILQANAALPFDAHGHQGVISVRAHATAALARCGRPWLVFQAADDLKSFLVLRERSSPHPWSLGEAQTDVGRMWFMMLRRKRGLALMEEGVKNLRQATAPEGKAFLVRGLRKLALSLMVVGRVDEAKQAFAEIDRVSTEIEAMGQFWQVQREIAASQINTRG